MNKIVLLGEGGAGKTSTAKKLINDLRSDNTLVLQSMCHLESTPYGMFHQLLDSFLDLDLFDKREVNDAIDQALVIAGGFLLGPVAGFMGGKNDEGFSKEDIFVSIKEKFKTLSKNKEIIIFVDDLQWIDNASRELLKYIIDEFNDNNNFKLICTSRPMSNDNLFDYLMLKNDIQHVGNLNKEEQVEFLRNTFQLSNDVSNWIVDWISDMPTVYPFALVDVVSNLYRNDALIKSNYGYIFNEKFDKENPIIPDGIRNEILNIINKYPEYQDILGLCATYGKEFNVVLLAEALDINILKLTQILNQLSEDTGLILDLLSKDNIYTFKSQISLDALRNIIGFSTKSFLDNSVPQVIRYYHQTLASVMENHNFSIVNVANHYYASSKTSVKKAINSLLKASDLCKNIYEFEDGLEYIQKAKELAVVDNSFNKRIEQVELLLLAEIEFVTGKPTIKLVEKLINFIGSSQTTDEIKIATARSCYDCGRLLDRAYFQKCVEISESFLINSTHKLTQAEGYHFAAIGMDNTEENKIKKIKYFENSLELSSTSNIIYSKIANSYAGYLSYGSSQDKEKALDLFNQSKDIKENLEVRDLPGLARTYGGLGRLSLFSGDKDRLKNALEYFEEDLKISMDLKDSYGISNMYSFIGTTYKKMKKFNLAIEYFDKSINLEHNKEDFYVSSLGKIESAVMQGKLENIEKLIEIINSKKEVLGDIPEFATIDIKKLLKETKNEFILNLLRI